VLNTDFKPREDVAMAIRPTARRLAALASALTAAAFTASVALAIPAFPLTLTVTGSTTVYPTAHGVAVGPYAGTYSDVQFNGGDVAQPGSGVGIGVLLCGNADVADASRPLNAGDNTSTAGGCGASHPIQTAQVDQWVVGKDGITIVANSGSLGALGGPGLQVSDLTNIYSCNHAALPTGTWHDINAAFPASPIIAWSRETTSGTYGDFLGFIGVTPAAEQTCAGAADGFVKRIPGTGNPVMVAQTQGNANSIAYVGFGFADAAGLTIAPVNGLAPNPNNIDSGQYVFSRQLFMDTIKASALPAGTRTDNYARALNFVNTTTGQNGQTVLVGQGEVALITNNNPVTSQSCFTLSGQTVCPQLLPIWDVDLSFKDDVNDIVAIGQCWQCNPGGSHHGWDRRDVTDDGTVDINDIVAVGQHWQSTWTSWSH